MANKTREELKVLRGQVRKLVDTIDYYADLFAADGTVDAKEQAALDKLSATVKQIEAKIDEKEDTLGFGQKILNKSTEVTEDIADFISKKDDIVDHSLVDQAALGNTDTPTTVTDPSIDEDTTTTDTPNEEDTTPVAPTTKTISKDVGKGCPNVEADVTLVQELLNDNGENLTVDGDCGKKTIAAIEKFQSANMNGFSDGIISVGGRTWKLLVAGGETVTTPVEDEDTTPVVTDPVDEDDTTTPVVTEPVGDVTQKSVGKGGVNDTNDVLIVQKLLKDTWDYDVPQTGVVEAKTLQAIAKFQHRFAGMINSQDALIGAGGTTWKYLTGVLKPTLEKQEDGTLAGAETDIEKKLAEFAKNVSDIEIEVAPGEIITVRPPYHQNNSRQAVVDAARAKNSAVNKIIGKMGWNDKHGKATPSAIKDFLEACIAKNLISDKTSTGLNQFLDKFGISLDCSGLAVQAVNFLKEGDMERGSDETLRITNARNIMNYGTKISAPKDLVAGDMMVNSGHVRVITDVDITGNVVEFSTLESGASKDLGYGDGVGDSGDGVGDRRWKFENANKFENCQTLKGNTWKSGGGDYVYTRMDDAAIARIQAL